MRKLETLKTQDAALSTAIVVMLLLVLPHFGAVAMMVGAAVGLVLFCVFHEFRPGPLDPHGTRVKAGCVAAAVIAVIVAAYVLLQTLVQLR